MNYLLIFIGGGLGSIARYGTGNLMSSWFKMALPIGTLVSNLMACILLALVIVFFAPKTESLSWVSPLLIIGFCGGYSTFSTFSNQTFELMNQGQYFWAIMNVLISVVAGIGLIFLIRSKMMS